MIKVANFKRYPITSRESEFMDHVADYYEEHGYTPLPREIAEKMGVTPSRVRHIAHKLQAKGQIKYIPRVHRGIRLLEV